MPSPRSPHKLEFPGQSPQSTLYFSLTKLTSTITYTNSRKWPFYIWFSGEGSDFACLVLCFIKCLLPCPAYQGLHTGERLAGAWREGKMDRQTDGEGRRGNKGMKTTSRTVTRLEEKHHRPSIRQEAGLLPQQTERIFVSSGTVVH